MGKLSQAHLELQEAMDVTLKMARQFIDTIKVLDVPHIVTPYSVRGRRSFGLLGTAGHHLEHSSWENLPRTALGNTVEDILRTH